MGASRGGGGGGGDVISGAGGSKEGIISSKLAIIIIFVCSIPWFLKSGQSLEEGTVSFLWSNELLLGYVPGRTVLGVSAKA